MSRRKPTKIWSYCPGMQKILALKLLKIIARTHEGRFQLQQFHYLRYVVNTVLYRAHCTYIVFCTFASDGIKLILNKTADILKNCRVQQIKSRVTDAPALDCVQHAFKNCAFFKLNTWVVVQKSVSQSPCRGPVPGPGINYTGPREGLLGFVILIF